MENIKSSEINERSKCIECLPIDKELCDQTKRSIEKAQADYLRFHDFYEWKKKEIAKSKREIKEAVEKFVSLASNDEEYRDKEQVSKIKAKAEVIWRPIIQALDDLQSANNHSAKPEERSEIKAKVEVILRQAIQALDDLESANDHFDTPEI